MNRAQRRAVNRTPNKFRGRIGWCHSCETLQMGDEARLLPMRWNDDRYEWACVTCDDEPWGLGVWPDREGYDDPGRTITPAAAAFLAAERGPSEVVMPPGRVG